MEIAKNVHAFIWKSMSANNCNTYLIDGPTRVLIDPGHSRLFGHVKEGLSKLGFGLDDIGLIILTHAHPDHIEAVELFKETPALTTLHENEWHFVKGMDRYISATYGRNSDSIGPDFFLKEGNLSVNGIHLQVFHTPGHSPGSVSLFLPEQKLLFTGDLVFKAGIGRTDVPGGAGALLKESITKVSELEIEWLLPGHGDFVNGTKAVNANFDHIKQVWFSYL